MESTSTKMEAMKPVLLKAGIPLAVTVAGFIIARITRRKGSFSQASCSQTHKNSPENEPAGICRDEGGLPGLDSEKESGNHALADSQSKNTGKLQEEMISLKGRIEDSQGRERELETRFDYYNLLKEQEMLLMEQENRSLMEITKIEILEKEISVLQGESQRFEKMVADYLKTIELLECSRSENVLLHRRVKRLQKKAKHLSHAVNPKTLQLKAKEAEISRNQSELKNKDDTINQIEEDFRQVKTALEKLQHERDELLNKLEMIRKADPYKNDAEVVSMDDYKELVHELEKLHESKAAEEKELVYLRWCNACLRHELTRANQEDENQSEVNNNGDSGEIADFASDSELRSSSVGHHESCLGFPIGGHSHDHSKRKKLVQKFKKWSEKMKHKLDEREKHHTKCSANHSYSATAGDLILPARNSFSSA
nr:protein CHUP1, chloroplastic [Ipomoea batatas]